MKGVVVFDSVHGNTARVAEAMADLLKAGGHVVEIVDLSQEGRLPDEGDFMLLGSPTRVGNATKNARRFLDSIDPSVWKGKPIAMFDTVGPLPKDKEKQRVWLDRILKSAATRLRDQAADRGLNAQREVLHVPVTGFMGPLTPDWLEPVKNFIQDFLKRLQS